MNLLCLFRPFVGEGFNDRPFFDGPPDRGSGFDRGDGGNGGRGGRLSRGPGGDRGDRGDRGGRPGWNDRPADDRPKSQEKNDDKDPSKRATSRWATTESSSPTVVSDEENWDDEDVGSSSAADKKDGKVKETLVPLPQTEPIDDDSQEDDFNDFEEDAADILTPATSADRRSSSVERNKPVAIVEIGDDSSSSVELSTQVEEITSNSSEPTRGDDDPCENATPLYDEPENKEKPDDQMQSRTDDGGHRSEQDDEEDQEDGRRHVDEVGEESRHEAPEEDNQEDDHFDDQNSNQNQQSNDDVSNGDGGDVADVETSFNDRSDDEQASRPGDDEEVDEVEEPEPHCPTPDAHIDSEDERPEFNAPQTADVNDDDDEDNDEHEENNDDAVQSD